MSQHSLRFADPDLQAAFVRKVQAAGAPHSIGGGGEVLSDPEFWGQVNAAAHEVRDSCFPWFFMWSDTPEGSSAFAERLRRSGLPFHVEYHRDRQVFLLAKQHRQQYETLHGEG